MERAPSFLHPTVRYPSTTYPPHPIFPSSRPYTPFHIYGGSGSHVTAFRSENNVGRPIEAEEIGGEFMSRQRRGSFVRSYPHITVDFFPWPPHKSPIHTMRHVSVPSPFRLPSVRMVCVHTARCVQSPSRTAYGMRHEIIFIKYAAHCHGFIFHYLLIIRTSVMTE
jgi:hypothetical protein